MLAGPPDVRLAERSNGYAALGLEREYFISANDFQLAILYLDAF